MLVNFTVKNFKSFQEEANLSLVASAMKETAEIPAQAFFEQNRGLHILPVAAIYGANASGKSNIIDALAQMKYFIQNSLAQDSPPEKIPVQPFFLSTKERKEPTEFEITFIVGSIQYRYGFVASSDEVLEEWLFSLELIPHTREKELFYREGDILKVHSSFTIGHAITKNPIKNNVLVLTLADALNDEKVHGIMNWIGGLNTLKGYEDHEYQHYSQYQIRKKTDLADEITQLIRDADTNIQSLSTAEIFNKEEILATHKVYNEKKEAVSEFMLIMDRQESAGTRKLFRFSGPLLQTLKCGNVLIVDELDSQLHPNLMEKLVWMFQNRQINKRGAQLIFTNHNTNLLSAKLLRRDQVWITEKDTYGASRLYSIADYKTAAGKARNTEAIEQNYIDGKYGGIPFLGALENFLENKSNEPAGTKEE